MITIELEGKSYEVDPANCEIDWHIVDNGIGPYEFWGAVGFDSRKEPEIEDITVREAFEEDSGEEIKDPKILQALGDAAFKNLEPWYQHLQNLEIDFDPEPDYEPDYED